jgi:hypothetical protein
VGRWGESERARENERVSERERERGRASEIESERESDRVSEREREGERSKESDLQQLVGAKHLDDVTLRDVSSLRAPNRPCFRPFFF